MKRAFLLVASFVLTLLSTGVFAQTARLTEYLDRGVFAINTGNSVFVSWRLFATEPQDIGFNLYRTSNGATEKLNSAVLTRGTNFTDNTAVRTRANTYFVRTVQNGVESDTDGSYTLAANAPASHTVIPIRPGNEIHFIWVGDFTGNGKYDWLVDRLCWTDACSQKLEAYEHDGTFLWEVDLGPGSKNNISPGPSVISVGHWDGVTVYDIDGCGRAEVILRVGSGVKLGDGTTFNTSTSNANLQSLIVLDGQTGKLKASTPLPTDYLSYGPLAAQLGIGHLDGRNPSVVAYMKNRIGGSGSNFNMITAAYDYTNGQFGMRWKHLRGNQNLPDGHQMRIADADLDGKDEIHHIGFTLNGDGTLKYSLATEGIVHGDRFYVGRFNKGDNFLMGYGVQQDNPSGILEYTYNAATGKTIWKNSVTGPAGDVGRGNCGDIDPRSPGYECWSFHGIFSNSGTRLTNADQRPYPVLRLWWDGDGLSQSYNDGKIERWNYLNNTVGRILTTWNFSSATGSDRGCPMFYGDILGDWREEVVMTSSDYSKIIIFSTDRPSDIRLFTLSQDQTYRAGMTVKGYMQSHMAGFYLGSDMDMPVPPKLEYIKTPNSSSSSVASSSSSHSPSSSSAVPSSSSVVPLSSSSIAGVIIAGGDIIGDITLYDPANAAAWKVSTTGFDVGLKAFGDREFLVSAVLPIVQGAEWVSPSMETRKNMAPATMLHFNMKRDAIVYLMHEDRVFEKPDWITTAGFTVVASTAGEEGEKVTVTDATAPRKYTIYSKNFAQGARVDIGLNTIDGNPNSLMYLIAAKEESATPILKKTPALSTHFSVRSLNGKTLLVESSSPTVLDIFDLSGKKVASYNVLGTSQTLHLNLQSGVYFARARGMPSVKFVVR
ncbi:MAG: hypothetical protein LBU89_13975 [Fibromonadaceae bacterium]|jgi:hypothetical protein|nr:hypothetical protein [Fibromonadaceae bacterium]